MIKIGNGLLIEALVNRIKKRVDKILNDLVDKMNTALGSLKRLER